MHIVGLIKVIWDIMLKYMLEEGNQYQELTCIWLWQPRCDNPNMCPIALQQEVGPFYC